MKEFIKNNKEVLILLLCLWLSVAFLLIIIKLSNIQKELSSITSELENVSSEIRFNIGELGNLRKLDWLETISKEINTLKWKL